MLLPAISFHWEAAGVGVAMLCKDVSRTLFDMAF